MNTHNKHKKQVSLQEALASLFPPEVVQALALMEIHEVILVNPIEQQPTEVAESMIPLDFLVSRGSRAQLLENEKD